MMKLRTPFTFRSIASLFCAITLASLHAITYAQASNAPKAPAIEKAPAAAKAVATNAPLSELATRLVGTWREYAPSTNFVQFTKEGEFKLFLKKGEMQDQRSIVGTWKLDNEQRVTLAFEVNAQKIERTGLKLSFAGEEMTLIDGQTETKHKKHVGELPAEYRW